MKSKIISKFTLLAIAGLITTGFATDSKIYSKFTSTDNNTNEELLRIALSKPIVEGVVSGFDCAVVGELCPTTHRGADYTTGVFTEEDRFYFIVNIPQSFLQQYFRETIEVEGTGYDPYNHAIEPEIIYLIEEGGGRRLVYESGYFIDEEGNRATFQDGVYENGKWTVKGK